MISQFFVLSRRGDTLIWRDYRGDVSKGSTHVFFRNISESRRNAAPVFTEDGVNYFHIMKSSMYFVATSRMNVSPGMVLELLGRISGLFRDFCGYLNEEAVRKNFILIYELLDELLDCGCVQESSSESLKSYILNEPIPSSDEGKEEKSKKGDKRKTVSSSASRRPIAYGAESASVVNEIFLDLIERIDAVFDGEGNILSSLIRGTIVMKCFLTGRPQVRLGLNEDLVISDDSPSSGRVRIDGCSFHNRVNVEEFELDRTLVLNPPEGEFTVMNYRVSSEVTIPFVIQPFVEEAGPFRMNIVLRVRGNFSRDSHGSGILISCGVPKDTTSVGFDMEENAEEQDAEYRASEKNVYWTIKSFYGDNEHFLRIKVGLSTTFSENKMDVGPIQYGSPSLLLLKFISSYVFSMQFELSMFNTSGVNIRFLRVEEPGRSENPMRWIRYITQANSYTVRF